MRPLVIAFRALIPRAPDFESEIGRTVDCLEQYEELGRLPERLRGNGLATVHQKAVAMIVIVEDLIDEFREP